MGDEEGDDQARGDEEFREEAYHGAHAQGRYPEFCTKGKQKSGEGNVCVSRPRTVLTGALPGRFAEPQL
ncbi:hypothetical protein GCM10009550_66720 [Actinocorallia libanotica]|uniref:Uncharacterized protein n=1 Tax=Actinocorallia libanotica TaxID=46162 RepID=A0ABN1RW16_9ACTN